MQSGRFPAVTDTTALLRRGGREALAAGDAAQVKRIATALQGQADGIAEGSFLLSILEVEAGRIGAALEMIGKAAALSPCAEYEAHHARLLLTAGRDREAQIAAIRAEALGPADALTFDTLGCIHTRLGAHAEAAHLFEQAVASAPNNIDFRYNLAVACSFLGRTGEAEKHLSKIIAAAPANGRAHFALSGLRRHTPERNHLAQLEQALASTQDSEDRLRIRFALAKELDECGQPAAALRHLQPACEQRKADAGYKFTRDARLFDAVEKLFSAQVPVAGGGDPAKAPIFVVGMPRTGTTLVDRILSSHIEVQSAGELLAMPLAVKRASGSRSRGVVDAETIEAAAGVQASDIAAAYLARLRQHPAADAARFVDKLPFNFLYAGFIRHAFPAAKIVCLRRSPMDTIWSNYRHLFAAGSALHHYSYHPEDVARYYLRFHRLIAFWHETLPGAVFELRYEDLVADQEGQTRRLLDHCELVWDDACLRFHEHEGAVATPSAAQVRRPVSADAVGQWRPYADALVAARALIEEAGIAVD